MSGVNINRLGYDMADNDSAVIPSSLAITAMRDSGYKNTAYALAELIDNAQQENADCIEVICRQADSLVKERTRSRISEIGVLDNGGGMTPEILRKALQFGNGSRLNDRSGIGRFGMGLPNASISQAGRVDVWTWQNGPDNAYHSYLDVSEIEAGKMSFIPEPNQAAVPSEWTSLSQCIGKTGTLVVWSKLDFNRLTWKSAKSTLKNTEQIAGRIYRRFIHDGSLRIRLLAIKDDGEVITDEDAKVVDPLYLLPSPIVPEPFKNKPMFELVGEEPIEIDYGGKKHTVKVRYSVARQETVEAASGNDRGRTAYGKHAQANMGVSVVRAGRELMLDKGWCNGYDPRERWWGAEVEFPPALDEIFGVTNNKQAATHFSELATIDWQQLAEEGEEFIDVVRRLKEDDDPVGWLLELSDSLKRNLRQLLETVKAQAAGSRGSRKERHDSADDATASANEAWSRRAKEKPIDDDTAEISDDELETLKDQLQEENKYSETDAEELINLIKEKKLKVVFLEADFPDYFQLFNVVSKGGVTEVTFNRKHPMFDEVFGTVNTVDDDINELSKEEILERLMRAINASKLLFAAWARYEREAGVDRARALAKVRMEWGQMAASFLDADNESAL